MRKQCIFILLLSLSFAFGQEENPPAVEQVVEPAVVPVKENIDKNSISVDSLVTHQVKTENKIYPKNIQPSFKTKYQGEEFDYSLTKPQKSLWEKIKERWENFWESIFGKTKYKVDENAFEAILKLLAILLGAFILFFILRFFLDKNRRSIFGKKNKKLNIKADKLDENIHEIDFPSSILHFESQKDYRSAVRYQFLQLLKKMNAQNIITWNPEKTNRDYEIEIASENTKTKYQKWSYIFENVWYGEFEIDSETYKGFKQEFENAKF